MSYRYPDFLIIGAQKCGTTSLFHYLSQHPDLAMPKKKEIHFFDLNYEKGTTWYKRFFPERELTGNKLTGEASPYYFFHPCVPERVAGLLPDVKLIVLLRNPVERAYSHFVMERNRNHEPLESFAEAVESEYERTAGEEEKLIEGTISKSLAHRFFSYSGRGMYGKQMERWLEYFPLNRFHIIRSEDFFNNPVSEMIGVYDFLNIPVVPPADLTPQRVTRYAALSPETAVRIKGLFSDDNNLLTSLIGDRFCWNS